jgi:hypothetical protein
MGYGDNVLVLGFVLKRFDMMESLLTLEEKCQFPISICDYKTIATNIYY